MKYSRISAYSGLSINSLVSWCMPNSMRIYQQGSQNRPPCTQVSSQSCQLKPLSLQPLDTQSNMCTSQNFSCTSFPPSIEESTSHESVRSSGYSPCSFASILIVDIDWLNVSPVCGSSSTGIMPNSSLSAISFMTVAYSSMVILLSWKDTLEQWRSSLMGSAWPQQSEQQRMYFGGFSNRAGVESTSI
ncbi:hypothetical protein FGO68_gene3357 [Halteria grandinella]|uniref:Uncharacterized protein n=1 Tax=Halteria grandinella TaxID=5974 RepID=A0A8J8SZK7_HALGN|nr:hypothetical protein FGO68_gene3357 [Halteria grandinella]